MGEGVDVAGRRPGDRRAPASAATPSWSRCPRRRSLPLPEKLSFEQGAAFPVNYGTAYAALVMMGGLQRGRPRADPRRGRRRRDRRHPDRAGASARRSSAPPRPPSTRRSARRASTHAIDYRNAGLRATRCRRITGGEGVDVIIDAIGPDRASARTTASCARAGG